VLRANPDSGLAVNGRRADLRRSQRHRRRAHDGPAVAEKNGHGIFPVADAGEGRACPTKRQAASTLGFIDPGTQKRVASISSGDVSWRARCLSVPHSSITASTSVSSSNTSAPS